METELEPRENPAHPTGGQPVPGDSAPRPSWKAWIVTVLVAIILSVTATLLLGGYATNRAAPASSPGSAGCGGGCCDTGGK